LGAGGSVTPSETPSFPLFVILVLGTRIHEFVDAV
jgi:hypothetical protein